MKGVKIEVAGAGYIKLSESPAHVTSGVAGFRFTVSWGKHGDKYGGVLSITEAQKLINHLQTQINSLDKTEKANSAGSV